MPPTTKGDIILTRDVDVIEMGDIGLDGTPHRGGTSWNISAKRATKSEKPAADWVDSFRRAERRPLKSRDGGYQQTPAPVVPAGEHHYDLGAANVRTANTALARELKGRHLQMIAFGGAIGNGLFVASGGSLSTGGPASLFLAFFIIGLLQYCTMQSLGELCVLFPVAGSFSAYSSRFLDPSWGFAMGWNYCLEWVFVLPLEIIAAAYTISYWNEEVSKSVFVAIFLVIIIIINLFGVKAYGEAEFIFSIIKVTAVVGFILLGTVINIGGHPESGYIGWQYWQNPGAFHNGFKGFCTVLVTSSAAFAGTELIGLAAAETANPRKSLPTAIKQVFWRITIFYCVSLLLVGLLVPYDEPRLLGGKNSADALASPFVIAIESAGTSILPSIMNGVILVAVISVGNSAVYASSRTLMALAEQAYAPQIFTYVDKRGRPLVAILLTLLIGLLAFLAELESNGVVFNWLLSISTLSMLFTWGSICLCQIRFRAAWAHAGCSLEQLPFRSTVGIKGAYFGLAGYFLILLGQIWIAVSPIKLADDSVGTRVQAFFLRVVALPVIILFYVVHKLWYKTRLIRANEMDIVTGRRYSRVHISTEQEREEKLNWPFWKKVYRILC
ncbi:amino acid permease-domain-containing protein [Dactylonectria macrodidyma]|uniref:Amino acid permease-domain-containing protein n=1 Tax=Dactylonectria macrodidyma TaxID=307937 RepID=A0A9P9E9Y6_9HYPO|nr:amino acid permease-domain-containing protein [Dactylonectria macrodidyma]